MKPFPALDAENNPKLSHSLVKSKRLLWTFTILLPLTGGAVWNSLQNSAPQAATANAATANAATANAATANAATLAKSAKAVVVSSSGAMLERDAPSAASASQNEAAKPLEYEVQGVYAHDVRAFTQGLVWHNDSFYESTGLNGQSTLRRVAFPSGRVLVKRDVPSQYFAEGLAIANDKLVQITWKSGKAFVYDRSNFKLLKTWSYEGEGWGLAFDGERFVMSDGSDTLYFRSMTDFKVVRSVRVTLNGKPLNQLNELEVIDGQVWANVWQTDFIVQIDPRNGRVVSYLDLSNLHPRSGHDDVLNGIAYDKTSKRLFVTGKLWPKLYQLKVVSRK